jgi:hypothetical protein
MSREPSVLSIDVSSQVATSRNASLRPVKHGERRRLRHGGPRPRVPELDGSSSGRPGWSERRAGARVGRTGESWCSTPAGSRTSDRVRSGAARPQRGRACRAAPRRARAARGAPDRRGAGRCRGRCRRGAHGLSYEPQALLGIGPLWGRSVLHCPFCDGWEVRDRALAVHGNGPDVVRTAVVVSGWSSDVVLLTDGPASVARCSLGRRPAVVTRGQASSRRAIALAGAGLRALSRLPACATEPYRCVSAPSRERSRRLTPRGVAARR